MNLFNIIAGTASILSLIISLLAISKVIKIEKNIKNNEVIQEIKGNSNVQTGRDATIKSK